jgi:uncharacterized protein YndB with AHSA1/START domain
MRTVRETVLVEAKPESVWEVLMDPYYTPKLYPDMINITADPPGRAVVGQNRTLGGRAGKRLIEFKTQVSELVPNKLFAIKGRPGGALEEFTEVVELAPLKRGTELKVTYVFKVSEDYFGPEFDLLTLEQMAVRNEEVYIKNLKALAELRPVE